MKSEYSDKLDLVPINNSRAIRVEGGVRFIV
jgi:S51 family peptidase